MASPQGASKRRAVCITTYSPRYMEKSAGHAQKLGAADTGGDAFMAMGMAGDDAEASLRRDLFRKLFPRYNDEELVYGNSAQLPMRNPFGVCDEHSSAIANLRPSVRDLVRHPEKSRDDGIQIARCSGLNPSVFPTHFSRERNPTTSKYLLPTSYAGCKIVYFGGGEDEHGRGTQPRVTAGRVEDGHRHQRLENVRMETAVSLEQLETASPSADKKDKERRDSWSCDATEQLPWVPDAVEYVRSRPSHRCESEDDVSQNARLHHSTTTTEREGEEASSSAACTQSCEHGEDSSMDSGQRTPLGAAESFDATSSEEYGDEEEEAEEEDAGYWTRYQSMASLEQLEAIIEAQHAALIEKGILHVTPPESDTGPEKGASALMHDSRRQTYEGFNGPYDYDDGDFDFEVDPNIRTSQELAGNHVDETRRLRRSHEAFLDAPTTRQRIPSRPSAPTPSKMRKGGSPVYAAVSPGGIEEDSDSDAEAAAYIANVARSDLGRRSVDNFFQYSPR